MCHYVVGSSCHDTSCLSMQKHLDNKQVSCCALSSQLFRLAAVSVDRNALNCCHETWWNLIGEPLGIWSIMATIRWCPIYPKWDSYQPLENEPALSGNPFLPMILTHTRHTHCQASAGEKQDLPCPKVGVHLRSVLVGRAANVGEKRRNFRHETCGFNGIW